MTLRWYKSEVLESLAAEYERLGRPLDQTDLNPDVIVDFVGRHFSSGVTGSAFSDPPRPPSAVDSIPPAAPAAGHADAGEVAIFYVLSNNNGTWQLQAYSLDGQLVQMMDLPDPGVGGYYSLTFSGNEFAISVPGQQPVPCNDLMFGVEVESSAPAAPPALPPGVAAHSALLPGMTSHCGGGWCCVQSIDLRVHTYVCDMYKYIYIY